MMPNVNKPYLVWTDASKFAIGAILLQPDEDEIYHPVAYFSKKLQPAELNYEVHDLELLAIIRALEHWRHYLEGAKHPFDIWIDHKNLEYFRTNPKLSLRQARWSLYLSRFEFVLQHKAGKTNPADALSRRPDHYPEQGVEEKQTLLRPDWFKTRAAQTVTIEAQIDPDRLQRLQDKGLFDEEVAQALRTVRNLGSPSATKGLENWNETNGIIYYHGRVYVFKDPELRREIIREAHDGEMTGHPGKDKTLELIQRTYWWPQMGKFIASFIRGCPVCQSTKNQTHKAVIPLQPTEVPLAPFDTITADFIVELPEVNGINALLVVTDRFTKFIILIPCNTKVTAKETAQLLINHVILRFGPFKKLISDRGPQFAAKVFIEIMKGLGIKSALSTPYHPQTDGATERVNQEIEQYLRAYCNNDQTNWVKLIPKAAYAHNVRIHSITHQSPYQLLHGYNPPINPVISTVSTNITITNRLTAMQEGWE